MMVKSEFPYEEVNPYTCRLHVANYLTNADGINLSNVDELYDLDKAGELLYWYMCAHSSDIFEEYYEGGWMTPFEALDESVLTDVCMACERDTEAEAE